MDSNIRDYGQDQELAKQFLRDFSELNEEGQPEPKYAHQLTELANREKIHLVIDLADVEKFNQELADQIIANTTRYIQIFYDALDEILPSYKTRTPEMKDTMDVFIEQRLFVAERNQRAQQGPLPSAGASQAQATVRIEGKYPPDLIRRAEISFRPPTLVATPIRAVKAEHVGKLVTVRGIVTRTTDVKPKITIATYTCEQCGCESFQPVKGLDFTPLNECTSSICVSNKTLGKINLQVRGSKFVKFQEIKLQEHSDHVPTGHIPRAMTVMAHGELTRKCAAGDHISVSGIFLPLKRSGFQMQNMGLTSDIYLEAQYLTLMNKTEDDQLDTEPMTEEEAIEFIAGQENFLSKLSYSIAPEIFGNEQLKKALLLLLVGGVDRNPYGMKIRGNINICLMGDPGVAKSQFLSFVDRLASRSQYTTGRGSSGVGLTAAVLKDPITNELVLEGGALVLADEGICCIDEFDKMMEADRTAIHEVMEQQTVSIAKAGIMTTLNARVSILAAANPAYGRYNVARSVTDNLQLPPALLSRFDLLWLMKDRPDTGKDLNLAQHVTHIHAHPNEQPVNDYDAIDMKLMRRYINLCKTKNPVVPETLTDKLVNIYLDIRSLTRNRESEAMFTSPRSLLAILRLATALARLRLADTVEEDDVNAAVSLYNYSRSSIEDSNRGESSLYPDILDALRKFSRKLGSEQLPLDDVYEHMESQGFKKDTVEAALQQMNEAEILALERDEVYLIS